MNQALVGGGAVRLSQTNIGVRMTEVDLTASGADRSADGEISKAVPAHLELLARRERSLWRLALLVLAALAIALAVLSRGWLKDLPYNLEALPLGLLVLVSLFGLYMWMKSKELSELRGLVRGIEQRSIAAGSDGKQIEQLFSLISRSQQGYRDLIDTFDDHLFSLTLGGEIMAANRSFSALLDAPFPSLVGKRLEDFVDLPHGNGVSAAKRSLPQLLERRHWSGVLAVQLKRESTVRYFDCVFHAIVRDGAVCGVSALARDVTAERESETRFTELFETLQEGVYLASPDGRITDANPALVHLLGYGGRDEMIGLPLCDLYCDPAESAADQAALAQEGLIRGRQLALRSKRGEEVAGLHSISAIRDTTGNIVRLHGTVVDLTEHKEMERRLRREREFARRLMDSLPDLVFVLDRELRYTFASPSLKDVLGYEPDELICSRLGDRAEPEDRPALLAMFRELIAGHGTQGTIEYRSRHKSGEWRLMRTTVRPVVDTEGHIEGVIASARDITEQRHVEQQLVQSERLAAMGQMIAGVAHELNNPLTAILGVTELLREGVEEPAMRRQLDLAHRQARRAAHIVQSLLTFSRPPSPRKVPLQLNDALQRTLQLHEYSLRTNNITLDFEQRADLPLVMGDMNQLMQVFLNLITNAEQAILEVRDRGTVRVRLEPAGDFVRVLFQDDGVGISRDILSKLFDPFFTTKRPGRGTGLGLSISMAIVREHGGNITAEPLAAGGSLFVISLPVSRPSQVIFESASGGSEVAQVPSSPLEGRTVLVVDDEDGIRELIHDGLSARGMMVHAVSSSESALEQVRHHAYDVVLCDLHLGDTGTAASPLELRRKLLSVARASTGHVPLFVFMTGDLLDDSDLQAMEGRHGRVIQKPFRVSDLVALLAAELEAAAAKHTAGSRVN
ncbi:MAG: PAS domain S-box protein [Candidatus Acidiferrales bacterium]